MKDFFYFINHFFFCFTFSFRTYHKNSIRALSNGEETSRNDIANFLKIRDWKESDEGKFRLTYPSNFWDDISIPFWSMPENTDHPTQKPEKLYAKLILASSRPGDIVFDPFLGSGTASVVAKKLGRNYCGIELNEEYAMLAEKRLQLAEKDKTIQGTNNNGNKLLYDAIFVGLTTDRETLYNRINLRVDYMIKDGLVDEVKSFYEKDSTSIFTAHQHYSGKCPRHRIYI